MEKKIDLGLIEVAALAKSCGDEQQSESGAGNNNGISMTTTGQDEEEKKARLAPKPKPKFDPKSGKWVVKSWDGSVAGVENGEMRSFDDLYATNKSGPLASNLGAVGQSEQSNGGSSNSSIGGSAGNGTTQQQTSLQQQQQRAQRNNVSFQEHTTPFAIIDEVSPNSPASEAGLIENDVIIRFGDINSTNHREFRAIAELVQLTASENKSISVAVRRKTMELGGVVEVIKTEIVELKPRTWGGRGLLGCHIRPYTE